MHQLKGRKLDICALYECVHLTPFQPGSEIEFTMLEVVQTRTMDRKQGNKLY
jgi:hypothetical protein